MPRALEDPGLISQMFTTPTNMKDKNVDHCVQPGDANFILMQHLNQSQKPQSDIVNYNWDESTTNLHGGEV
jgi:hypothetical protein